MGVWDKLFGKGKAKEAAAIPADSSRPAESNERINRLWESAKKLGLSDAEREKAVSIYSEILSLVNVDSTSLNVGAIFWQRAVSYRILKKYDAALDDLKRAVEFAERRNDQHLVWDCQRVIEEIRVEKRNLEIEASGGKKAEKFKAMEQQAHKLWGAGPEADAAFENLFADLQNDDPDIRDEASRLLAESTPNIIRKLITIYQECLNSDPRRASLAGRVLGRRIVKKRDMEIDARENKAFYGIAVSFISCPCVHCYYMNTGIPAPPNGPMVAYYHQIDDKGAYAVPVLCDKCGKEFFVVWDVDPR
jgi:tetratricopeptide (TPR) repeat protein